jgi:hypothetical protein
MSDQPQPKPKFRKVKLKPSLAYREFAAKKKELTPNPRIAKIHKAEDKAVDEALQEAWLDRAIRFSKHPGVNVAYAIPNRHDFYD